MMAALAWVRRPRLGVVAGGHPLVRAEAMTWRSGRAIVHRIHSPVQQSVTGGIVSIAFAAAALAATVGLSGAGLPGLGLAAPGPAAGRTVFVPADVARSPVVAPISSPELRPASSAAGAMVPIPVLAEPTVPASLLRSASAHEPFIPTIDLSGSPGGPLPAAEGLAIAATTSPAAAVTAVSAAPAPASSASGEPVPTPGFTGVELTAPEIRSTALTAGWPAELVDDLEEVAWCESRFRADAIGGGALGIMQIMPFWFAFAGEDLAAWANPLVNLRVALVAYRYDIALGLAPWAPWTCKPSSQRAPATEPPPAAPPAATAVQAAPAGAPGAQAPAAPAQASPAASSTAAPAATPAASR
jgi:hypothetical protein